MFVYTLWDHRKIHHSEVKNITKFTKRIYYRPDLFSSEKKIKFSWQETIYTFTLFKKEKIMLLHGIYRKV